MLTERALALPVRYERLVDLTEVEHEMARLDAIYHPVAATRVERPDLNTLMTLGTRIEAALAELAVDDQAEAMLRKIIELYRAGDETTRAAIRRLFDRYTSFRWAAHLPREWDTAEEFRARLIHLSARDQAADTRDEILTLHDLCARARRAGIDVDPVLDEVSAISSHVDRYGMGSMRTILLRYGKHPSGG